MKITAIIGSPRKGNTYETVQRLTKSMQESADVELKPCPGCLDILSREA